MPDSNSVPHHTPLNFPKKPTPNQDEDCHSPVSNDSEESSPTTSMLDAPGLPVDEVTSQVVDSENSLIGISFPGPESDEPVNGAVLDTHRKVGSRSVEHEVNKDPREQEDQTDHEDHTADKDDKEDRAPHDVSSLYEVVDVKETENSCGIDVEFTIKQLKWKIAQFWESPLELSLPPQQDADMVGYLEWMSATDLATWTWLSEFEYFLDYLEMQPPKNVVHFIIGFFKYAITITENPNIQLAISSYQIADALGIKSKKVREYRKNMERGGVIKLIKEGGHDSSGKKASIYSIGQFGFINQMNYVPKPGKTLYLNKTEE